MHSMRGATPPCSAGSSHGVPAQASPPWTSLRTSDRALVLLNAPVVWAGDAAHPYGEALVHFDQTKLASMFASLASLPAWRLHLYAALNAYIILAYAERFSGTPLEQVRPWGRERPLLVLLDEHLQMLRACGPGTSEMGAATIGPRH